MEPAADELTRKRIEWHFPPPSASHFGGAWERLIRSAKTALQIVLHNRSVTDDVLNSAMTGVESVLNGRPLTYVSVDPNAPEALTPNHFLLGRSNPNIPPDELDLRYQPPTAKTWRDGQVITSHFWNRWLRDYVPDRIERRRWLNHRRNLAVNDIVIIVETHQPRGHWPLGRVVETHSGPDGVTRAVTVRTATGLLTRPVAKLGLLEEATTQDLSN